MKYKLIVDRGTKPNLHFNLQVLDHPGACHFWKIFSRIAVEIHHNNTFAARVPNTYEQQPMLNHICHVARKLEREYGIVCNFDLITNVQDVDQDWLNLAHRFFTSESGKNNTRNFLTKEHKEMQSLLYEINDTVHCLESYYPAVNNDFSDPDQIGYCMLNLLDKVSYKDRQQIHFTEYEKTFHSAPDEHHDLVLSTNILGKSVKESYWNDDDPNHWDTSGHHLTFGETILLSDNYTKKIYTGGKFASWMRKYNTNFEKLKFDYPIADFSTSADRDRWLNYINDTKLWTTCDGEMIAK